MRTPIKFGSAIVALLWVMAAAVVAADQKFEERPPDVYLVVIDVSGSMMGSLPAPVEPQLQKASRLQEVQRRLKLLADSLPDGTRVIVSEFDTETRRRGDITLASPTDRDQLRQMFQSVASRKGSTYLWRTALAQLQLATQIGAASADQRVRMLLYTDGEDTENAPGLDHNSVIAQFGDRLDSYIQWDWVTLGYDVKPEVRQSLEKKGVRFHAALKPTDLVPLRADMLLSARQIKVGQSLQVADRSLGVEVTKRRIDWGDGSFDVGDGPHRKTYTKPGSYRVSLAVTTKDDQTSTTDETVEVTLPDRIAAKVAVSDQAVKCGQSVIATDLSQPWPTVRRWFINNVESKETGVQLKIPAKQHGTITVRLEVEGPFGQSSQDDASITVNLPAAPVAKISVPQSKVIHGGTLMAADDSGAERNVTREWLLDGSSLGDSPVVKLPTDKEGEHKLELKLTDSFDRTNSAIATYQVVLPQRPVAAFDLPNAMQAPGDKVTLVNKSTGATRWVWHIGDAEPLRDQHPTFTIADFDDIPIRLEVSDDLGRTDEAEAVLKVPRPNAPVAEISGPEKCEIGESISLIDRSKGAIELGEWLMNGKVVGDESVLQLRPDRSGPLVVVRRVTGPGGTDSCEFTVDVSNYPPPVAAVLGPKNCVVGDSISLVDRSTGKIESGEWQLKGKSIDHDVTLHVKPDRPGPLIVVRRVNGPGGTDSCEFTIQVSNYPPPVAGFLVSNLQPVSGDSVTVHDSASGVIEHRQFELLQYSDGEATTPSETIRVLAKTTEDDDCPRSFNEIFEQTGQFVIRQTVIGPGGQDMAEQPITVTERYVTPTASLLPSTMAGVGATEVRFLNKSSGSVVHAWFDAGDGSPIVDVADQASFVHEYAPGEWHPSLKVYGPEEPIPALWTTNEALVIDAPTPAWIRRLWWQIPAGVVLVAFLAGVWLWRRAVIAAEEAMLLSGELNVRRPGAPHSAARFTFGGDAPEETVAFENWEIRIASAGGDPDPQYRAYLQKDGLPIAEVELEDAIETELGELSLAYLP